MTTATVIAPGTRVRISRDTRPEMNGITAVVLPREDDLPADRTCVDLDVLPLLADYAGLTVHAWWFPTDALDPVVGSDAEVVALLDPHLQGGLPAAEPIVVTREDAIELLRQVVAEHGPDTIGSFKVGDDSTYSYFEYIDGDTRLEDAAPVCVVGHAVARIGVKLTDLQPLPGADFDDFDEPWLLNGLGLDVVRFDGVTLTDGALELLTRAQALQDTGYRWGMVLQLLDIAVPAHPDASAL